jgi:hypothetical protein
MVQGRLGPRAVCFTTTSGEPLMSADHRKPVVAFVVLAFLAAALVGVQRADAQAGRLMAAVLGGDVHEQSQVHAVETFGRPAPSGLPESITLASGGPTTAAPQVAGPDARKAAQVTRGHGRSEAPAAVDRQLARSGASGEHKPADQAAERAHTSVSKPIPDRAVANGHTPAEHGHHAARPRSTR